MSQTLHKRQWRGTGIRLHPWLLWSLIVVMIGVELSGCLWTVSADILEFDGPQLRLFAQLHGAFATLSLVLVGALLPQHVRFAWSAGRNRLSGSAMLLKVAILVVTGYGLYYGAQAWHAPIKWIHIAAGLACLLVLPLHLILGARSRPVRG